MSASPATPPPSPSPGLGRRERMLLAAVAAALAVLLLWLRGGLHPEASLEALARRSPDFATALSDGRPTVVEFYADWCEACRAMAPAMDSLERQHRADLDVVLLNVDNPRWQGEIERFDVNGIPHLELFDAAGQPVGRSLGARRPEELEALTAALLTGTPLPALAGVGAISDLAGPAASQPATPSAPSAPSGTAIGPRSHG